MQYLPFHIWFSSFIIMSSRFIQVGAGVRISSFLRLNNIPLYVYNTFYLSIHPLWDRWLLSPFGYYKYGVGSTVVQVYVRVPVFTSFGYKPRSGMELLDHVGILRLTFRGAAILFSTMVHHFAVPSFFLFFSQNSSSATALQHLPFISTPQTATLYTKWLCLSHLLEVKKKVALIVKTVVLQWGLAVGDWWSPLHPIRYFILVKWRAANFVKYF